MTSNLSQLLYAACGLEDLSFPFSFLCFALYTYYTFEGRVSFSLLVYSDLKLKMWV